MSTNKRDKKLEEGTSHIPPPSQSPTHLATAAPEWQRLYGAISREFAQQQSSAAINQLKK